MNESTPTRIPHDDVRFVAGHCLCLKAQRAARALARRFDTVFRPFGLTNGQFSLMISLNAPQPPQLTQLADFLAMDRTTLTAMLKPLERRGLVEIRPVEKDRRARQLLITKQGVALLEAALPVWRATHAEVDAEISISKADRLRADLPALAAAPAVRPAT
jgi:DNA-binding MarR family transcriptional regulator